MSGIIFDLDGTLIDSAPQIHAASETVMRAEAMRTLPLDAVRGFIGNGVPVLISRCIAAAGADETPELHARMSRHFSEIYETSFDRTALYPGVSDMLHALKADGFRLGLCTNKPEAAARAVLAHFGLGEVFDAMACGDAGLPAKPDPAPLRHVVSQLPARQFLYVGDSEVDAETAHHSGLPFALYTRGYRHTPPEEIYHDATFDDFAQLRAIIDRIAPLPE